MTGRDLRVAGITLGLAVAIVAVIALIGLSNQHSCGGGSGSGCPTSTPKASGDGAGPRDGVLIAIPTTPPVALDQSAVICHDALLSGPLVQDPPMRESCIRGQPMTAPGSASV